MKTTKQKPDVTPDVDLVSLKIRRELRDQLRKVAALETMTIAEVADEAMVFWLKDYERRTGFKIPLEPLLRPDRSPRK